MSVYAIAQLTINDREQYQRYAEQFLDVLHQYAGKLLAADDHPKLVEGEWGRDKIVLIEFGDEPAFRLWIGSPEYTAIAKDRIASTTGNIVLVRGL